MVHAVAILSGLAPSVPRFLVADEVFLAGAFLLPAETFACEVRTPVTLDDLLLLKKRWGVSVAALNYRLHKLKVVSDWQNRSLNIEIIEPAPERAGAIFADILLNNHITPPLVTYALP